MKSRSEETCGMVAVDVETTGLKWSDRVLTVSVARKEESGIETLVLNFGYFQQANLFGATGASADSRDVAIVPITIPDARRAFWEFVERRSPVVFHNGSFDIPYLLRAGVITRGEMARLSIFDTMVMARATGPHESVSLENLCAEEGIGNEEWRAEKTMRSRMETIPYERLEAYSRLDAAHTWQLASRMLPKAVDIYGPFGTGGLLDEESGWVKAVSMLRYFGLGVSTEKLAERETEMKDEAREIASGLRGAGIKGPNDRSGILAWAEKNGLTVYLGRTPKGNPSVDSDSMKLVVAAASLIEGDRGEEIRRVALAIVKGRSVEKALSTWITGTLDRVGDDGRVHPLFTTSGAKSNRLSCREPNVQAYPHEHCFFTARPGYELWSLDWSQAELRIAAMLSTENQFARIFAQPGADPHMETAYAIFGEDAGKEQRTLAKRASFASIYGGGSRAIVEATGCDEGAAKRLLADHRRVFRAMATASRQAEQIWIRRGYLILMGGKRRYASRSDIEHSYKAFNQVIQGSVAEMIKRAMLQIAEELPHLLLVNQVHDSVVVEAPVGDRASVERAAIAMVEVVPVEYRDRTDPPIEMKVDIKRE